MGSYITCAQCGCKYWAYVPTLAESQAPGGVREPARPRERDDHAVAIRQESLLATIHDEVVALRRTIAIAACVVAVSCVATIAVLLTR